MSSSEARRFLTTSVLTTVTRRITLHTVLSPTAIWDMAFGTTPLLRNWQFSGIFVYQSGRTANVTYNGPNKCFGLIGCQIAAAQNIWSADRS